MSNTHIRLDTVTRAKIDHLKGAKSFSDYIALMLKYFELTGINPESMQAPLAQETKNGIERIVKIIKAIEKEKLNKIIMLLENFSVPVETAKVDAIDETDLLQVVDMNEKLSEEVGELRREKEMLRTKNRALSEEFEKLRSCQTNTSVDTKSLLEIVEWFEQQKPGSFSQTISIKEEALKDIAKRLRKTISYVHEDQ